MSCPHWRRPLLAAAALAVAAATGAPGATSAIAQSSAASQADPDAEWDRLYQQASRAFAQPEFEQGPDFAMRRVNDPVPLGERALQFARSHFPPDDPRIVYSLALLAMIHHGEQNYAEAVRLLEPLIAPIDPLQSRDGSAAEFVEILAGSLAQIDRFDDAELYYRRALQLRDRLDGPDSEAALSVLSSLAHFYGQRRRHADAEPLWARILGARERRLLDAGGQEDAAREYWSAMSDLARNYTSQYRFADAERLYREAGDRFAGRFGADHALVRRARAEVRSRLEQQGRYTELEPDIVREAEASVRDFQQGNVDAMEALEGVARFYWAIGRPAEAEDILIQVTRDALAQPESEHLGEREGIAVATLADLYMSQGRYAEAEVLIRRRCGPAPEPGEDEWFAIRCRSEIADLRIAQGRHAEAEPLLLERLAWDEREALTMSDGVWFLRLPTIEQLALVYEMTGRPSQAEQYYRRGLALIDARLAPPTPAQPLSMSRDAALDFVQSWFGGDPYLARVLGYDHDTSMESSALLDTLAFRDAAAGYYRRTGRFDEAEAQLRRALEDSVRYLGDDHPVSLPLTFRLASLYAEQHRAADANPLLERALAQSGRLFGTGHFLSLRIAAALTRLLAGSSADAPALRTARDLLAQGLDLARQRESIDQPRSAATGDDGFNLARGFALAADADWTIARQAADAAAPAAAFAVLQHAARGSAGSAIARSTARQLADRRSPELGRLVRERESLLEAHRALDRRSLGSIADSDAETQLFRANLDAERAGVEAGLERVNRRLESEFPDYFALTRDEPVDLAAAQALLGEDEALLLVVPAEFGTHLLAVTRTGARWVRSEWNEARINRAVTRLLWDVGASVEIGAEQAAAWDAADVDGYPFDRATAHDLYRQVVAPVAELIAGKRHLFVVAAGSLTGLPFGILVAEPPVGDDGDPAALRATAWLADRFALSQLPSVRALQLLRAPARRSGRGAASFAGFGDPALQGAAAERGRVRSAAFSRALFSGRRFRSGAAMADPAQLRLLSRLPGTAVELEQIRRSLGAPAASLFLRERATEANLRAADLFGTRIIVLATHGIMAGELVGVGEPGLVLTPPLQPSESDDGLLTASEVASLRLDADWVIMSACNTAAGDGAQGSPGLSGLARAFFFAGARSLLASHWPVRDEVAARLTVRTIQLLRERPELGRAGAFQLAMREIRQDAGHDSEDDTWAHPNAWAPFTLIGDGASR